MKLGRERRTIIVEPLKEPGYKEPETVPQKESQPLPEKIPERQLTPTKK